MDTMGYILYIHIDKYIYIQYMYSSGGNLIPAKGDSKTNYATKSPPDFVYP